MICTEFILNTYPFTWRWVSGCTGRSISDSSVKIRSLKFRKILTLKRGWSNGPLSSGRKPNLFHVVLKKNSCPETKKSWIRKQKCANENENICYHLQRYPNRTSLNSRSQKETKALIETLCRYVIPACCALVGRQFMQNCDMTYEATEKVSREV